MHCITSIMVVFALFGALLSAHAGDADALYSQAKDALRKSQSTPGQIVVAARLFSQAAALYEKEGNTSATQEAHSFLYWCKKKMTLQDAEALQKDADAALLTTLTAVEQKTVDPAEAETWLKRAEAFATENPREHLLIAVRYFEVADRFKGTDFGLRAMDESLKAMQRIEQPNGQAASSPVVPQYAPKAPALPSGRQPIPEAAKVSAAQKSIRDVFKAEFAAPAPDARLALAHKLLQQTRDEADAPTRYALLREAVDLATKHNDAALIVQIADALETGYECDGVDETLQAFNRMSVAAMTPPQAAELCERLFALAEKAQARDQFDKLPALTALAGRAGPRAASKDLADRIRVWTAECSEAAREFTALKKHIATLEKSPQDEEANLAFGRFYVFYYNDLARGLPALAAGSDKALKAIAQQETANPAEPAAQIALGGAWRTWSTGKSEVLKNRATDRAIFWLKKGVQGATGLDRMKAEKDLRDLALSRPLHGIPPAALAALGLGDKLPLKALKAIGNTGRSGKFEDIPASGSVLIGAEITTGKDFAATVVKSIAPIYLTRDGIVTGSAFGKVLQDSTKLLAKPGYVVGGVTCRSGGRMDRIRFTFVRVTPRGLDPRDSYDSDWVGGKGGNVDIKSDSEGRVVYGIHGHAFDNLDAIGLMVKE